MAELMTPSKATQEPLQAEKPQDASSENAPTSDEEQSDDEEEEETHDAVGFGDAMSKILGQNVAEDAQPILAKRTTARMREIQSDKKETKTARLSAAEKREREQKDMALPDHTTAVQDRKLRMIATKGVVALFNAIEKHQHQAGKKEDKNDKKKPTGKSSWSVVQDDFMMGAKLKDWDNQHGTEVGRVRETGDVDVEAAEDVAWKQAGDVLDSDGETAESNKPSKRRTSSSSKGSKKAKRVSRELDDERDVQSDDGSQWSSYDEIPSSPTDSFSCPMPSPESDEDEDEDYAPSETSLGDAGSVTSSVDTDDLDPDNEMDQDEVIDLTQQDKNHSVFYAWKDLKAAFEDNPLKDAMWRQRRREEEEQTEAEGAEKLNMFDVEAGQWSFQAGFAPGVADKKPPRRRTSTAQHRPTGVSPRFSALFTGDKNTASQSNTTVDLSMESMSEKQDEASGEGNETAFRFPSVEIPDFTAKHTNASKTPNFSFGRTGSTTFSGDTHMRSSSPRYTAKEPFVPVDGGFTIGQGGKPPKPYNFASNGGDKFSSKAPPAVKIVADGNDTHMRSPSTQAKPASRTPTNGEFLFGQAYKNRNSFTLSRQNSSESVHTNGSPSTSATGFPWGSDVPIGGTSAGGLDANRTSVFFTTGVAGPSMQQRHSDRRKKKNSTSSTFVPPPKSSASASPFDVSTSVPTFGSSLFQAATATRERPNTSSTPPAALFGTKSHAQASESTQPSIGNASGSYEFGSTKAKPFQAADSSPFQTGIFGSASSSTTANTDTSEQVLFGNGTSRHPFRFGEAETNSQTEATTSYSTGLHSASVTTDGFQIGSSTTKKNSRVRPRKSGMFTNKNSPRKDAKLGSNEPEPSPGFSSLSSPATPSPFGMHNRRSRKNARLRRNGRSPPADPFVMPTFQSHSTSSPFVSANAVRPTAKKGSPHPVEAPTASANPFGAFQGSQSPNQSSIFAPNEASQPVQPRQDIIRPAFAGSRRILRAALRKVGAREDRARSAPPSNNHTEGDAEMDSEDERDWEELKRLGGVAHCSRKYQEAAEYYRQSIEAQANLDTARQLMEGLGGEVRAGDQADHASLTKMEETIKKLTVLQGEIKWYVDSGDFQQALVHTDSALVLAPSSRKLQVQKAQILLHQREFDQLVEFCNSTIEKQQAAQRKRSSPVGRDGNRVEDAVPILNALEAVAPCSSHVIQLKRQWQDLKQLKHNGNERFKRGEYQEAVRFYSEAVQIDPQHQEFCAIIYCNRAAAQMGLERYHTAILDCNEALQRKPTTRVRCSVELADVALEMYHEAVKDFDRYLREQPRDRPRNEAKAAIAKAREEARQRDAAKKRAEREQRQRRQRQWEEPSWNDSRFYENFRRNTGSSSNGNGYGSNRHQSSGAGSRASFMAPKTQRRTHYDVLGIEKTATNDQIKKAYRKLALVYHPDKAKSSTHADLFKEMTAAYNVLSDESARSAYDRELIYNRFGNFYEN
ncbi:Tetratricopeptide repeat [Phytophthora cactorum]|nr:Tetratricopeptide repeat [Phytophthora cactorum]